MAVSRSFSACQASCCWRVRRSRARCRNTSLLPCRLSRARLAEHALQLLAGVNRGLLAFRAQNFLALEAGAQNLQLDPQRLLAAGAPNERRQDAQHHCPRPAPARASDRSYSTARREPVQKIERLGQVAIAAPKRRNLRRPASSRKWPPMRASRPRARPARRAPHRPRRCTPPGTAWASAAACSRGRGCGLRSASGIAADHASEAGTQPQFAKQRFGEPRRLVGDDPALDAPAGQCIQYFVHAGKQPRFAAERAAIDLQEAPLKAQRRFADPHPENLVSPRARCRDSPSCEPRRRAAAAAIPRGAEHSARRPCRARCRARCRPDRITPPRAPCQAERLKCAR